jgi:hypothetical protein
MDGGVFDRITRTLVSTSVRRKALHGALGAGIVAVAGRLGNDAEAKKKKHRKKKCAQCPDVCETCGTTGTPCCDLREDCSNGKTCCGQDAAETACRSHSKQLCATLLPGDRCCGIEGTACDPNAGDCDCCDDLKCDNFVCSQPG